jgi:hypothetical protein
MQCTLQRHCDWYFVVDVDNFIKPNTLLDLVSTRLPHRRPTFETR